MNGKPTGGSLFNHVPSSQAWQFKQSLVGRASLSSRFFGSATGFKEEKHKVRHLPGESH
jgi:hypothetical protein